MHTITSAEIIRSLIGAWRLFLRDPSGLAFFEGDISAFWKSFWCALIIVPAYAILVALRVVELEAATNVALDPFRVISVELISYVIGWVIWPLVMLEMVKMLNKQKNYLRYIIVYNWTQAPILLFALTMIGLESTGLLPEGLSLILGIFFYVWIIVIHIFIFKVTMALTIGMALPLAVAEIILGIVIFTFKYNLLGVL